MNVQDMVRNWDAWGNDDPMYSILTEPSKANRGWNEREFFESGEHQIDQRITWFREQRIPLRFGKALDFGCGLGRLTNALARYFEVAHGVDISRSMIEQARKYCRYPEKIQFFQNIRADLSDFKTGEYDLVYSEIALQHVPTKFQISYIADFLRLLAPQGIACFQTTRAAGWRAFVPNWLADLYRVRKYRGRAFFPMYPIRPKTVERIVRQAGCFMLSHQPDVVGRGVERFLGDLYLVSKCPPPLPQA